MNKVIIILEAKVSEEKWDILRSAYRAVKENQPQPMPLQSFLVQMKEDSTLWRIISVWESTDVLQSARDSGETPAGILMFRNAEAEPTLSVFETKEEI